MFTLKTTSMESCLGELMEKRIEITNDEIAKTAWYNELQNKLIEIQGTLSPENKRILAECNAIREEIFYKTETAIYRQAFRDGMETAKAMAPILAPK